MSPDATPSVTAAEVDDFISALAGDDSPTELEATTPAEAALQDNSADIAEKPKSPAVAQLDAIVDYLGERYLGSESDFSLLLQVSAATFSTAEQAKELTRCGRREGKGHFARSVDGYRADEVCNWIKAKNIPWVFTATARALLDATPAEAIDPAEYYNQGYVVMHFGVDVDELEQALMKGKIKDASGTASNSGRINGAGLASWIAADGVEHRWSVRTANRVARNRRPAPAIDTSPSRASDLASEVFDRLEEERAAEQAKKNADQAAMWGAYREILRRMKTPANDDARQLEELIGLLDLTREDVRQDLAALKLAEEIEAEMKTAPACKVELMAAGEARRELRKRHEAELLAAERRVNEAYRKHNRATAGGASRLQDIHSHRPYLFVGD